MVGEAAALADLTWAEVAGMVALLSGSAVGIRMNLTLLS